MPAIDDLEVIRELLAGKPPSEDVSAYVRGRLTAAIAADSHPGARRPVRGGLRSRRNLAVVARRRRRRLALRSAAGVAAALAGVVALAVIGVPGARHDGTGLTADVVKRVDSALTVAGPGEIAQMTVTNSGGTVPGGTTAASTDEEWSYGDRWRAVAYSSAGHPVYDEGFSASSVYTWVSYQTRTWARQPVQVRPAVPVSGSSGCEPVATTLPVLFQPGLPSPGPSASSLSTTVATALRTAISCGTLTEAGRQRVDGIEAIKLISRPDSPVPETIWVSPDTYLPVRVVVPPSKPDAPWLTANIIWLPPTAQNLGKLTVPVPAGFRHSPSPLVPKSK